MARAGRRPYEGRQHSPAATYPARVVRHLRSGLTIRVTECEGRPCAAVSGDIDLDCADTLERALAECLEPAPGGLDVDLSAVGFTDCAGLNALLRVRARAHAVGAGMTLTATSPAVAHMLNLTHCWDAFVPEAPPASTDPAHPAPWRPTGAAPSPRTPGSALRRRAIPVADRGPR